MKRENPIPSAVDEFNHILPLIRNYLDQFKIKENSLQETMRLFARQDQKEHWLIPVEVGIFFYLLTRISGARKIYEMGSYLGYSATWFAEALPANGKLILTENNEGRYQKALQFLKGNPSSAKIEIRNCDAHEDLNNEKELFDIILIDHDKPFYQKAYEIAKTKLKENGFIIADNVLWRGRIIKEEWQEDDSTTGVLAFNEYIMNDPEYISLIVPIGDGVSITLRR